MENAKNKNFQIHLCEVNLKWSSPLYTFLSVSDIPQFYYYIVNQASNYYGGYTIDNLTNPNPTFKLKKNIPGNLKSTILTT